MDRRSFHRPAQVDLPDPLHAFEFIVQHSCSKAIVIVSLVPWSMTIGHLSIFLRSELAEKAEGKEAEAEKRKQKLEEKAARKREMLLKSLTE